MTKGLIYCVQLAGSISISFTRK